MENLEVRGPKAIACLISLNFRVFYVVFGCSFSDSALLFEFPSKLYGFWHLTSSFSVERDFNKAYLIKVMTKGQKSQKKNDDIFYERPLNWRRTVEWFFGFSNTKIIQ